MSDDISPARSPIHDWLGATSASYLTVPRSVLQSMPIRWQGRMVALLREMHDDLTAAGITLPETTVQVRDKRGHFVRDPMSDFAGGHRNVFGYRTGTATGVSPTGVSPERSQLVSMDVQRDMDALQKLLDADRLRLRTKISLFRQRLTRFMRPRSPGDDA